MYDSQVNNTGSSVRGQREGGRQENKSLIQEYEELKKANIMWQKLLNGRTYNRIKYKELK
tara:strand:- start:749 stop:928 length:180 start_codon:yes stop_codon:yes gene_type:complete